MSLNDSSCDIEDQYDSINLTTTLPSIIMLSSSSISDLASGVYELTANQITHLLILLFVKPFDVCCVPWDDGMGHEIFASHPMGREIFGICPVPWDEFFSSHPIPRGALVLIMRLIT